MYDYYLTINRALAERFLSEIDDTIMIVRRFPLSRSHFWKNYRLVLLPSFPYFLCYTIEEQKLVFHAVFPAKDDPDKILNSLQG
ncbi:MAG: hypothetical protein IM638_04940 [Bacteroidetes bacterium]|nr:hypothetical protein [Bacteroidota bacterium]